jgi:hypothetical protein
MNSLQHRSAFAPRTPVGSFKKDNTRDELSARLHYVPVWDIFMLLRYSISMRTTVDLPDALFRRTKALAAERGTSLKQLIVSAVEREVDAECQTQRPKRRVRLPLIRSTSGRKLDLRRFNFDDLLA